MLIYVLTACCSEAWVLSAASSMSQHCFFLQHMVSIKFHSKHFACGWSFLEVLFPRCKDFLAKSCPLISYATMMWGEKDRLLPLWCQNSHTWGGNWLRSWPNLKPAEINEHLLLAFVVFGSGHQSMILSAEGSGNCVFDFTGPRWSTVR